MAMAVAVAFAVAAIGSVAAAFFLPLLAYSAFEQLVRRHRPLQTSRYF